LDAFIHLNLILELAFIEPGRLRTLGWLPWLSKPAGQAYARVQALRAINSGRVSPAFNVLIEKRSNQDEKQ